MTAELTEARIADIRARMKGQWQALRISPDACDAICDAALRDVRARGQKLTAETAWHKAHDAWMKESRHGTKENADNAAIEIIKTPYTTPQPTYADGKRDGLLAAAKVCEKQRHRAGPAITWMDCKEAILAEAEKEPT